MRRDFGLERWRWPHGPAEEVFDVPPAALSGAPAGVPRVEVHQHERRVLVALVATRTDGSFSRRWGALSRTGELVAIDADLLTGPAPPAGFPAALTALLRGWDALQGEYGSHVCSTQMHFAHAGREPFPPFEEPGRRRPGRGRPATRP
ncbi:hypothetical protein [Kineococcus rubinsiae]|uniref:hypothetical protein n=1 Tax=Kineococcus rubinsiae TaxID=2609562 RepID=UPI0014303F08|nr:hypothetical protein [Kineococcus rubinsiae]